MKKVIFSLLMILFASANGLLAQNVYIPDTNFKSALLTNTAINSNNDGEIQYSEAAAYTGAIDVSNNGIASLTGIESFVNITNLFCDFNNLTHLDISANTALLGVLCRFNQISSVNLGYNVNLKVLKCNDNQITSLNIAGLPGLQILDCATNHISTLDIANNSLLVVLYIFGNQLTEINTSQNPALAVLVCGNNALTSLNLSSNSAITYIECQNNQLTGLDVSAQSLLQNLYCFSNVLSELDVSANSNLTTLQCYNNAIASLDCSSNHLLSYLDCSNNKLTALNVKNGNNTNLTTFNAKFNPSLACIQVDVVAYMNANWSGGKDATSTFNTICSPCTPTTSITTIQTTGYYVWNNTNYTASGTYEFHTTNAAGCDSIATLDLTINNIAGQNLLFNGSFEFPVQPNNNFNHDVGQTFNGWALKNNSTDIGIIRVDGTGVTGTNADENPDTASDGKQYVDMRGHDDYLYQDFTIAQTSSLVFGGSFANQSTTHPFYHNAPLYCAIEDENGTVVATSSTVLFDNTMSVKEWHPVIGNTVSLPPGNYKFVAFTTDFSDFDNAFVNAIEVSSCTPTSSTTTVQNCGNYSWNGTTYSASGIYTYITTNAAGCDSTVSLTLTILHNNSFIISGNNVAISNGDDTPSFADNTDFGNVESGEVETKTFTIFNTSAEPLNIINLYSSAFGVYVNNLSSNIILPGGSATFDVQVLYFYPAGEVNSVITLINDNCTVSDFTFSIKANVFCPVNQAEISVSGNNADIPNGFGNLPALQNNTDFGDVPLNTTVYKSFEINNQGTRNLEINIAFAFDLPSYTNQFSVWSLSTNPVPPGGTAILIVKFTPTTAGSIDGFVQIRNNDCDEGEFIFKVTGNNTDQCTPTTSVTDIQSCNSYSWNGNSYTSSGTYTYQTINAAGCDSTATLNLTLSHPTNASYNYYICEQNLPFNFNGIDYYAEASDTFHTTLPSGCDSATYLSLTVFHPQNTATYQTACDSIIWHGNTLIQTGTYFFTHGDITHCFSTDTLYLTITKSAKSITYDTICSYALPYLWNGTYYSQSGTYSAALTSSTGCDSIATVKLLVKQASGGYVQATVCANQLPYVFNGHSYNSSGSYFLNLINVAGCDSSLQLDLTVNPLPTVIAGTYPPVTTSNSLVTLMGTPVGGSFTGTGVSGNLFNPLVAGAGVHILTYTFTNTNGCTKSASATITVTNSQCDFFAGNISGPTNPCLLSSSTGTYTINANGANTYIWTVPNRAFITAGQGTNSLQVNFAPNFTGGQISVSITGNCGAATKTIMITPANPLTPGTIVGPTDACDYMTSTGSLVANYTIKKVANATSYIWEAPIGGTIVAHPGGTGVNDTIIAISYTSNFVQGNVSVMAVNRCGNSAKKFLQVSVARVLVPGTISGPTDICSFAFSGNDATYYINKVNQATGYDWVLTDNFSNPIITDAQITGHLGTGANDTAITVHFDGSFRNCLISVRAKRNCGVSTARTLSVVKKIPETPVITGNLTPCALSTEVYSTSVANTGSYFWNPPAGGTIISGQGTNSIRVRFNPNFISGTIYARAISVCGTSLPGSVAVSKCIPPIAKSSVTSNNKKLMSQTDVAVFPNPTSGLFSIAINSNNNMQNKAVINIVNDYGQTVYSRLVNNIQKSVVLKIDQSLPSGIYMVICKINEETITKKLIITK